MAVQRMEHIGIVVEDLDAATAFFVALGLELRGETTVEGEQVDRITDLEGARSELAFLQAPDDGVQLELAKFVSPPGPSGDRKAPANAPGIRHILFSVDDIESAVADLEAAEYELVGELVNYDDIYMLCYVRGPEGIIVELSERIG